MMAAGMPIVELRSIWRDFPFRVITPSKGNEFQGVTRIFRNW